ncbi:hypothetical protein KSZ_15400 [Dictyobacter formicarum]|uniref:Uncharacterized protein n=1 Tax=Dictyobacter formicarum TaxID=2778368 RepID=A0ABQ3VBW8_9CHLR|nr:hypothetical protein KSZ_15400 [Dictyobacter formicarum]
MNKLCGICLYIVYQVMTFVKAYLWNSEKYIAKRLYIIRFFITIILNNNGADGEISCVHH